MNALVRMRYVAGRFEVVETGEILSSAEAAVEYVTSTTGASASEAADSVAWCRAGRTLSLVQT